MFTLNSKRINVHAPHTTEEGVQYANLLNPEVRELLGVVEVAEPEAPADFSDETYYRTEQDEAPYVVYTRKSDEQLAVLHKAKCDAKLTAVRAVREVAINRLNGIADRLARKGDATVRATADAAVEALLDITKNTTTDPGALDAELAARYAAIVAPLVAAGSPLVSAFAELDV